MYRVIREFADLQDKNHVYRVGDKFPRTKRKASKERCKELLSTNNRIGKPLIEEVEE